MRQRVCRNEDSAILLSSPSRTITWSNLACVRTAPKKFDGSDDCWTGKCLVFHTRFRLAETDAKQPAVFGGVGQACGQHIIVEIEAVDDFFEGIIFVHGHDVLETKLL